MSLTRKDKQLLSLLLRSSETSLLHACENFLNEKFGKHNVFATSDFIYATGDIPILLVAHLDTVLYKSPVILANKEDTIWMGKEGLGADDRAGVFAILKILQAGYKPSVLFTTAEESGGLGAMAFVKDFPEPPVPTKYIIEIDRRGRGQAVFYGCGNTKFMSYIESFGFKTHKGIFSDISFICPHWDVAGVNLSAGYYNEHTELESLKIEDLLYTIEGVKKMLDSAGDAEIYNYEAKNLKEAVRTLYCGCQICGNIVPLFSVTNVQGTNVCVNCTNLYVDWCSTCGKPYFMEPTVNNKESLCEECANGLRRDSNTI